MDRVSGTHVQWAVAAREVDRTFWDSCFYCYVVLGLVFEHRQFLSPLSGGLAEIDAA
jgi:hypothetical protein